MRNGVLAGFSGQGGVVELEEAFIGKEPGVTLPPKAGGFRGSLMTICRCVYAVADECGSKNAGHSTTTPPSQSSPH